MVPHLITAQSGPINELEERILESMPAIERWFRLEWMEHTPPFYSAVDVRNAGFKLAPVDTVLHPKSFNHLGRAMLPLAVQAAMAAIEKICPEAKNLLLIPESQTRDPEYLSHLATLVRIFHQAGLHVRLGSLDADIRTPTALRTAEGDELVLEPLVRQRGRLGLKDFDPCTILLNNELASGVPQVLKHLEEQYLLPPLQAGWAVRRRSQHFKAYDELAKRFAKLLGMDPWLINPLFGQCEHVNEDDGAGLACAQAQVDTVLSKIRRKYKDYGITERPFVILKSDDGSQRLAGMTVYDAKDLEALNLGRGALSEVLIQEGVPTLERVQSAAAEPVVCMMDRYVVGAFTACTPSAAMTRTLTSRVPGSSRWPLPRRRSCLGWAFSPVPVRPTASTCMGWWRVWRCWRPATSWRPPTRTAKSWRPLRPDPMHLARLALFLLWPWLASAHGQALRVCIANLAYPPSITLDPANPGTRERQFLEAGRRAGVAVTLHYWPIKRCHRMVREGELDAVYLAATPESLADFRFPMDRQGKPDPRLRIKEEVVVLVRRRGDGPTWNGTQFSAPPRLGTRAGLRMAREAARLRGLEIDDSAFDTPQVLRKLHAGRHDFAVLLEVDLRGQEGLLEELDLERLPEPLARFDGFMAGAPGLAGPSLAALQAWWRALPGAAGSAPRS